MRFRQGCRLWWLAALALGLDRVTKALVQRQDGIRELIPGLFRCHPVHNSGMAFSVLSGHQWLVSAGTGLVLLALAVYLLAKPDDPPLARAGFWMILGGGLGNLIDRLAYGAVIDFIEPVFVRFAVFNVADVFVCVGAALAALGTLLYDRRKEPRHG